MYCASCRRCDQKEVLPCSVHTVAAPCRRRPPSVPAAPQSVNRRTPLSPPAHGRRRALRRTLTILLPLLLLAAIGLGWFYSARPQLCEGVGEVVYTDGDGSYQLTLAWQDAPYQPVETRWMNAAQGEQYRFPAMLFIHRADTGEDITQHFLRKVKEVSASFLPLEETLGTVSCTPPVLDETFTQGGALLSFVDYTAQVDFTARMEWSLVMENGDVIRIAQELSVTCIPVYDYRPGDAPTETAEQLQALVDRIAADAATAEGDQIVNLHLPAVTYTEPVVVSGQSISLYGSEENGRRTTFTAPLRLDYTANNQISYVENIDFVGSGGGVGLSTSARTWASDCTFTGWKTGFLGYGSAWVNAIGCTFTDNQVGFHFNSDGQSASHSMYNGNYFEDNGTAVLLERVPTDLTLNFQDSVFMGNQIDIDNRCGQPLDITQAVFQ